MTENEPENKAEALISHIEGCQEIKGPINKKALELMRSLAIDLHFQLESSEERIALLERDGRETWRAIKVLIESGLITAEQHDYAVHLVTDARKPGNTFTDVDEIRRRNIADRDGYRHS